MNNRSTAVQVKSGLAWWLYVLVTVWLSVSMAWWVYARFDYGYGYWYSKLNIAEHIATYAPQHPDKKAFALLSREQHVMAFRQIVDAVHDHGQGLDQIQYRAEGHEAQVLLDDAEVEHLHDVARMLDWGAVIFYLLCPLWFFLAYIVGKAALPNWRLRVAAMFGSVLPGVVVLAIVGPKAVFYQLHIMIFPANHQWFFYWEQSLMSTLMKAPYLFGDIAIVLGCFGTAIAVVLYVCGLRASRYLLRR